MRTFANHHTDTPHGDSHGPISVSVMLSAMFIGAQSVIYVLASVATPMRSPRVSNDPGFVFASAAVAILLLVFLAVDLRRNRIEAHGKQKHQYLVFGVAAALILGFLWYLALVSGVATPAS